MKWGIIPKTVIDIGANRGHFSAAIRYVFPDSAIFAFEPLRDCYDALCKRGRNFSNFHAYNVALSDMDGDSIIHRSSYDYSSSLLQMGDLHKQAFPHSAESVKENVSTRRLDGILTDVNIDHPILMKIDVQGSEHLVLRGAVETLKRTDAVLCELSFRPLYDKQPLFDDIYSVLVCSGFRFMGVLNQLRNPKDDVPLQIDGLFIREESLKFNNFEEPAISVI
ncbi:MAG: FkbM family methyltransferase [Cyclobacteriaceae bacterium]|nr:FkbM family methyltransferase [Cyclobacteriaceae bacterium]